MAKKMVYLPFGQIPCGSKFTSTGGSAFIKIAHDYEYNHDSDLALKICTGEIYKFNYNTLVIYKY